MKKVFWLFLAVPLLFASCKRGQRSPIPEEVVEEIKLPYLPKVEPYQASETKVFDLVHTKLRVSFDWEQQYLYGIANVTVKAHAYPQSELVLDAKGFDIDYVRLIEDDYSEDLRFTYDSLFLSIDLNKLYESGRKLQVEIKYTAKPNEIKNIESGSSAIKDDKGLYFINPLGKDKDKPRQVWTQGETEASSCWFPTIDAPNQKMTQEFYITMDSSFIVLSNGVHVYTVENGDGTNTSYWKQDKPHAPYLAMIAAGEFAEIKDTWNNIEVNYYVEQKFAPYAKDIFGNTPEMLEFFSERLNYEYPWDKYSQIIVRDYVSGAMENTSAAVFMEQLQMTDRELLDKDYETTIAHELFHHWFGDLVTCESWSNLPLNESFANYSEYLWLEYKYGVDEADYHRNEELGGYLNEAQKKREPLIRYHYGHRMEMFDAHSYNKGGLVLHMLRKYLGDDVFFAGLSYYLHENEYTDVEVHELRLAFEEVSGEDLNWFFNQWFFSPGHPEIMVRDTFNNGKLTVLVDQLQDVTYHDSLGFRSNAVYTFPVNISYYIGQRRFEQTVFVDGMNNEFVFDIDRKPDLVVFDDKQMLLAQLSHQKSVTAYGLQIEPQFSYQLRYDALQGLKMQLTKGPMVDNYIGLAINDAHWSIRKEGYDFLKELLYSNPFLIQQATEAAANDEKSHVRASALGYLIAISQNQEENLALYQNGLADLSYAVNAVSLEGYLKTNALDKAEKVAELRDVNSSSLVNAILKYYIEVGDSTQYEWTKSKFEKFGSGGKIDMVDSFAYYLLLGGVSSEGLKVAILYFEELGMTSDNMYDRYTAFRALYRLDPIVGVREIRTAIIANEKDDFLKGVYENWEAALVK
jgi:aminopeptidase N